jgi:hypothetical protein
MTREVHEAFQHADFPQAIRLIDRHFESTPYSLKNLFKDEQRRILDEILGSTREDLESRFRLITERYEPLMAFLRDVHTPLPPALQMVSDYILHGDLVHMFKQNEVDVGRLQHLLAIAVTRQVQVLDADLSYWVKDWLEARMLALAANPGEVESVAYIEEVAKLILPVPLGLNLWKVQNLYWEMLQKIAPAFRDRAAQGDAESQRWLSKFLDLGEGLYFVIDPALRQVQASSHEQAA